MDRSINKLKSNVMKKKLMFLCTVVLFGGMLMFNSDSAIAGEEPGSGIFTTCLREKLGCLVICPSCGRWYGSDAGNPGPASNTHGKCICGYVM